MKENLLDHHIVKEIIFWETSIKLFIMRKILWIIKFSVVVHLPVEITFSWWNSLTSSFFQFEASNWLIHEAHKIFLRVPPNILSGLLCYHKKSQQQLPETYFVIIATKFVSVFWAYHNKWKLWRYSVLVILLKAITFQEFLC